MGEMEEVEEEEGEEEGEEEDFHFQPLDHYN